MDYLSTYIGPNPSKGTTTHSQQHVLRMAKAEDATHFGAWAIPRITERTPEETAARTRQIREKYESYQRDLQTGDRVFSSARNFTQWTLEYGLTLIPPISLPQKLMATGVVAGLDKLLEVGLEAYRDSIDERVTNLLGKQMQSVGMSEEEAKAWSYDLHHGRRTWEAFSKALLGEGKDEQLLDGFRSDVSKQVGREYLKGTVERKCPDPITLFKQGERCNWEEDKKYFQGQLEAIGLQQGKAAEALEEIKLSMEQIDAEVRAIAQAQDSHADDLAFLKEFAYNRMTAQEKLAMLNMKGTDGKPLHFPHMKDRERARKLLDLQVNIVNKAQKYLNGAQMIGDILESEFGLEIPKGVKEVLKVGSALGDAANAFLNQNYIGAAMAVFSLFGKKKADPAAIRHQQIMDAFSEVLGNQAKILANQAEMKKMLETIIENQAKLLGAIQDLGRLIVQAHEETMRKLDQVHRDLLWTRRLLAEGTEQDIQTARTLVQVLDEQEGFDFEDGEFHSFEGTLRAFKKRIGDFIRGTQGFDNALRLDEPSNIFLISSHGNDLPQDAPDDRPYREINRDFTEKYYMPAWNVLMTLVGEKELPDWLRFSLMKPATEVTALLSKERTIQETDENGQRRIDRIEPEAPVCDSISKMTVAKMRRALYPTKVIEYGNVLAVFHALQPLVKSTSPVEVYTAKELAELPRPSTEGLKMINHMLIIIDWTFAQVGLVSGEGILPRLLELYSEADNGRFLKGVERWDAISKVFTQLLVDNPYLRFNFAKALCYHALTSGGRVAYPMAYERDNPLSLEGLFDRPSIKWSFEKKEVVNRDHEKEVLWHASVVIERHEKKIVLPQFRLPKPDELLDPKMSYPSDLSSLIDTRQKLVDAWLSYHPGKIWTGGLGDFARELMIKAAYEQQNQPEV